VLGTVAMYFREPTEATASELNLIEAVTRAGGTAISRHSAGSGINGR
jgi:hypothetical protein